MSLLNASHQLPQNPTALASGSGIISSTASDAVPHSASPLSKTPDSTQSSSTGASHRGYTQPGSSRVIYSTVLDDVFQNGEADRLVDVYRNSLTMRGPCVIVRTDMTARDVHRDSPFLFLAILFAASYDSSSRQHLLEDEIMKYISEHIILKGERSLDMLQGLLVFITW
jgi:hypothetical protein